MSSSPPIVGASSHRSSIPAVDVPAQQINSRSGSASLPAPGRASPSPSSSAVLPSPSAPAKSAAKQRSPTQSAPSAAKAPSKTLVIPPVPANSWYASPFSEPTTQAMSEYHVNHKGKVVFGSKAIPVRQAELDVLPNRSPVTSQFFDLGKDLLYGMAYLHNTALYTEHRWRGRVTHLQNVKEGLAEVPEPIRKACELRKENAEKTKEKGDTKKDPGAAAATANASASTTGGIMNMSRAEVTIYQHPFFDMLLGIKVFVNDELVADHYPGVKSLPQCTATIDTTDAVNCWNCVPIVLMGYLNHPTLSTIDLYRTLSLSFVEHLLHMRFPSISVPGTNGGSDQAGAATSSEKGASSSSKKKKDGNGASEGAGARSGLGSRSPLPAVAPGTRVMEIRLRVEVVYGCRSEAFYCTDFIARGSCTLFMAETAKPALKSYEEKLRALIIARRSSEQVIRAPREQPPSPSAKAGAATPVRTCQVCGNLMVFCCTVCGADFCGSLMCSRRPLPGYPCGCSAHKAMLT